MISRRRFLAVTAAFAGAGPALAAVTTGWQGIAFGAEASITLRGPAAEAKAALAEARAVIARAEALFSLHRPGSWLSGLNRAGHATAPASARELLDLCDQVHHLTGGLFDPTVQAFWTAAADGRDVEAARHLVDWSRVRLGSTVRLAPGQALTLNGIAQGWATDRVAEVLAANGFPDALVNIGEFRAEAGDWRIGIADPGEGLVRTITLSGGAVATSSPGADRINGQPHIFGPGGEAPRWSTVTVEARTAALADALSTALCLGPRELAATMARHRDVSAITLVAANGDLEVLR